MKYFLAGFSIFILLISCGNASEVWEIRIDGDLEVLEYYSEDVNPFLSYELEPGTNNQILLINCIIKTNSPDSDAVGKLAEQRDLIQDSVPSDSQLAGLFSASLSDSVKNTLNGSYRIFNLNNVKLSDNANNTYTPIWGELPQNCDLTLYWEGDFLDTFVDGNDPDNWHGVVRSAKTLVGLVDIGVELEIILIFEVPISKNMETLNLEIIE